MTRAARADAPILGFCAEDISPESLRYSLEAAAGRALELGYSRFAYGVGDALRVYAPYRGAESLTPRYERVCDE